MRLWYSTGTTCRGMKERFRKDTMMMTNTFDPCPDCDGTGEVLYEDPTNTDEERFVICDTCEGTGEVDDEG